MNNPFEPPTESDQQRRQETRRLAFFPTFYSVDGGRRRSALCVDLSISGLRLATHLELEPERPISVQVHVGDDAGDIWTLEGRIARVESREGSRYWPFLVGVRFLTPALALEARILDLAGEFQSDDAP